MRVSRKYNLKTGWACFRKQNDPFVHMIHLVPPHQYRIEKYDDQGALIDVKEAELSHHTEWWVLRSLWIGVFLYAFRNMKFRPTFLGGWENAVKYLAVSMLVLLSLPFAFAALAGGAEGESIYIISAGRVYTAASTYAWHLFFIGCIACAGFAAGTIIYLSGLIAKDEIPAIFKTVIGIGSGPETVKSLSSGRNPVVYQMPNETDIAFATRLQKEKGSLSGGICLLCVWFRNPICEIWDNTGLVMRGDLQAVGLNIERKHPATGESAQEYIAMVSQLPVWFDDLVLRQTASIEGQRQTFDAQAKAVINNQFDLSPCIVFLVAALIGFAPLSATAQGTVSEQVNALIGMVKYNEQAKGPVLIEVKPPKQRATSINLPAAGTIGETIEKSVSIQAIEKEQRVWVTSVTANGITSQPMRSFDEQPTISNDGQTREEQMRPNGTATKEPAGAKKSYIPDSSGIATKIENAKGVVEQWKQGLKESSRPVWEFVMWIFNSIIVFLICLGGLFRYISQTAASESAINLYGRIVVGRWLVAIHQNAAGILLMITWIVAVILLIDVFLWLAYLDLPMWLMIVIWFPILFFAEKLTNWLVPNVRVPGHGR